MKPQDLRIGNYVYLDDSMSKIIDITPKHLTHTAHYVPIPLTEWRLEELGFKLDHNVVVDFYEVKIFSKSLLPHNPDSLERIIIRYPEGHCEIGDTTRDEYDDCYLLNIDVDYVHELQNLYYSLTKEELKLNI